MSSRRRARTIRVFCANCGFYLYKYRKGGGGKLVKGRPPQVPGDLQFRTQLACETCPLGLGASNCGRAFARETMVYGRPASKIIRARWG